jgi:hypothetical protein
LKASRLARLTWLLAALLIASSAQAHLLNMTRMQAEFAADGEVTVTLSLDLMRATGSAGNYYRLSRSADPLNDPELRLLFAQLAQAIQLDVDGTRMGLHVQHVTLPQLPESAFHDPLNWPMTEVKLRGEIGAPTQHFRAAQARFDTAFAFEEPIAVTLRNAVDGRRMTRWLVAGQASPVFALHATDETPRSESQRQQSWAAILDYLRFGFEHILPRGLDHVLFVLGLYLGTKSMRSLFLLVTIFTVAHSVTLILASFGAIRLPASIVEPAIALSIAWIGVENLFFRNTQLRRVILVFLFGLLHGLGFAAALAELGLPQRNFVAALISFNVGVELGQLAVVAGALLTVGWFRQQTWYRGWIVLPCSAMVTLLALVWTVQRI